MRVLHVVRQFHPAIGGLEGVVHDLAVEQRRAGIESDVLTLDREFQEWNTRLPEVDIVDGVPVRRIGFVGSKRYPIAPKVLSHIRSYDLVHVHGVDFFCDYLALTAVAHRKPLVITTHGGYFHTAFARKLKRLYFHIVTRGALKAYKRVIACSGSDAETFRAIAGARVVHIDNGVDIKKFAGASSLIFKPSFVCFGRIASHKGLDRAIDAIAQLRTRYPTVELQILGNDADGTLDRLRAEYEAYLQQGWLKFKTGLGDNDIARTLAECSFFISASEYEGFGLALVEALSAGLIPVVSPIPSFDHIVAAAESGFIVNFDDRAQAATQIASVVDDVKARYAELRTRAMASVQQYSWESVEKRIRTEYEDVLGVRRRTILGVEFATMTRDEAVNKIDSDFEHGHTLRVAFANAHTLTLSQRDAAFRRVLDRFLVLNDGVGVDLASRVKFGSTFPDNLNGTDFVPHFLSATRHRLRIFLVGARQEVISEAARRFSERWPRHRIVGACNGYFRSDAEVENVCRAIKKSDADLLLVGLGNPLQELWIAEKAAVCGAPIQMGVGALFDFIAGRVPRAPMWVRRLRCEWVYRLACEPRRMFSRYVVGGIMFIGYVLGDRQTRRSA